MACVDDDDAVDMVDARRWCELVEADMERGSNGMAPLLLNGDVSGVACDAR